MKILLTGGAGYIGSHSLLKVLQSDHEVMVFDNFSKASPEALERVKRLSNKNFEVHEGDIRDRASITDACMAFRPDIVIHFAGLKAVGESVEQPLSYYEHNVFGTTQLLRAMEKSGCKNIVFSSTATVYGSPQYLPYDEKHPLAPESPYAKSKMMVEHIISDWNIANPDTTGVILRYFNPVGAHESHEIGEDPQGYPNNLMPFVQQVAIGKRPFLHIHGNDYDTGDGTGVRDYIHIDDLAQAHLDAVNFASKSTGTHHFNIGTGRGYSVLEVVTAFEAASGKSIPNKIGPRRAGNIAEMAADPQKAKTILGWSARYDMDAMCKSAWGFQSQNPNGYEK